MSRLHTLSNGVRVLCDPVPGFETYALSVVAGRGASAEPVTRSGWSHLLEHMVFKGAGERSSRQIVEDIEAVGGSINAQTGYERTSFQVRGLKGSLPLADATLGDLVLAPTLNPADLVKEKQVVGQEIAEAADTPDDHVFEVAQATAWGDHPMGRPVLGTVDSLSPADSATLGTWRSDLYAPDRLIVSAAGAVDEEEFLRLAETAFGHARGAGALPCDVPQFVGGTVATRRKLEQAHLVFLLPAISFNDPAQYAFRLLSEALGGGMSSRLFQEARENLGLAYAIDAYAETYAEAGALGVYAGCAAKDAKALAQVAAREIRKLASETMPLAELARCKALLKASIFFSRESLTARAEHTAAQMLMYGRLTSGQELADGIDAVQPADIVALAAQIIAPGRSAISILGPASAADAGPAFDKIIFG